MGGLELEIAVEIQMFQPKTLKDAINLACTCDEQLQCQRRPPWVID